MITAVKSLGQYFTPAYVAEFMIGLSQAETNAKILEPSCGNGVFIDLLKRRGFQNTVGYEIDRSLLNVGNHNVVYRSFVREEFSEKFDLIIGNPPYIRWKNLNQEQKDELESSDLWNTYFNSLCDYLCIFILKSVELLREGGELIFITPEYWINTQHAQTLRDYLVEHGYFADIIHFNETPIFDNVVSSILIFRYIKGDGKKQKINVVKYHSSKRLTNDTLSKIGSESTDNSIERFSRSQFRISERWILAPSTTEEKLVVFEQKCSLNTLGNIAHIGNGMVSGLDKAFKIPDDIELSADEKRATISVLKAKNIDRYTYGKINSYIFLNGVVKDENDLQSRFPTFYRLLSPHRSQLEKRYNYGRDIPYWEWVFLRSQKLFSKPQKRIFVPCKERISHKNYFRFAYVNSGIFPTQDVTAVLLKENVRESPYYILALLSSNIVFEWLRLKGVVKGSIVEFSQKPLASIPIKMIDWDNPREVQLHDSIAALVEQYIETGKQDLINSINESVGVLL